MKMILLQQLERDQMLIGSSAQAADLVDTEGGTVTTMLTAPLA